MLAKWTTFCLSDFLVLFQKTDLDNIDKTIVGGVPPLFKSDNQGMTLMEDHVCNVH